LAKTKWRIAFNDDNEIKNKVSKCAALMSEELNIKVCPSDVMRLAVREFLEKKLVAK
jgi:hypothetical protein